MSGIVVLAHGQNAHAAGIGELLRDFVLGANAQANVRAAPPALDRVAKGCLECHDGVAASHVSVRAAGSPMQFAGPRTANHPVGMRYDEHAGREPATFVSRALLNPNITLVDGRVTCVSCHRLKEGALTNGSERYAAAPQAAGCSASSRLTVERHLCLSCHNI